MDQTAELTVFIQRSLQGGKSREAIVNRLLQIGWSQAQIDRAFANLPLTNPITPATKEASPHKVRNGVMWILAPFLLLIIAAVLQFITHLFLHTDSVFGIVPLVNIFSILAGIAAIFLIPIGLIVGIITLTRH